MRPTTKLVELKGKTKNSRKGLYVLVKEPHKKGKYLRYQGPDIPLEAYAWAAQHNTSPHKLQQQVKKRTHSALISHWTKQVKTLQTPTWTRTSEDPLPHKKPPTQGQRSITIPLNALTPTRLKKDLEKVLRPFYTPTKLKKALRQLHYKKQHFSYTTKLHGSIEHKGKTHQDQHLITTTDHQNKTPTQYYNRYTGRKGPARQGKHIAGGDYLKDLIQYLTIPTANLQNNPLLDESGSIGTVNHGTITITYHHF